MLIVIFDITHWTILVLTMFFFFPKFILQMMPPQNLLNCNPLLIIFHRNSCYNSLRLSLLSCRLPVRRLHHLRRRRTRWLPLCLNLRLRLRVLHPPALSTRSPITTLGPQPSNFSPQASLLLMTWLAFWLIHQLPEGNINRVYLLRILSSFKRPRTLASPMSKLLVLNRASLPMVCLSKL